MLDDLSRAREGFVLASDLHLVYLATPINVEMEPDWELYYERFMELSPLDKVILPFFSSHFSSWMTIDAFFISGGRHLITVSVKDATRFIAFYCWSLYLFGM